MAQQEIAIQDLPPSFQPPVPALDRMARLCALAVLLIGLVVLAGWALNIEVLKSVLPGLTSMKPNTALSLVLAGIALALRQRSGLRVCCAAAMIVLAGLSLAQDVIGASLGTDELLFLDPPGAAQTVHPGRMSPITAIGIIVLGGALALLGTRRAALRWTLEALALVALALALIALIGYAYDTKAVFPLPGFGSMALLTPPALALLALGILCARIDGLSGVFASAGLGGQVARRFLPLALIAPVVIGGLVQMGEGAGLFDGMQDTAVFAAAMVLVLVALSWRNALTLEASDAERQQAGKKLSDHEALLRTLTEQAHVGLLMVSAAQRYVFANAAGVELLGLPSADIVGQRVADVMAPVYESQIRPRLDRAFGGERVAYELTLPPRAPGEGQRFLAVAYDPPVATVHGPCVIVVLVDITERKQAENALRESEAFSRSILKSSPDCIKVLDIDGNLLSMQSGQELLGIEDIKPFLNESWLDFWTGEDRPAAQAAVASAAAGGVGGFVGFFRTLRGDAKWWDVVISPILDANGKADRLLAVSRDVTGRQQAERLLRQNRDTFFNLIENAPFGLYIVDARFCLRQVSSASQKVFSNVRPLIGRDFEEVIRQIWAEPFASHVLLRFHHTLESGEPYAAPNTIEQRNDIPDVESYDWKIERITLPDGQFGVVCYFYDITERHLAEQALRESEERLRLAAGAANFGTYDRDLGGAYFHISAQIRQMLDCEPDAPLDHAQVMSHFHPDDQAAGMAALERACDPAGDGRIAIEQRIVRRDGGVRWIASVGRVLFEGGVAKRSLGVCIDITERNRLQRETLEQAQALADLDRRKDEFLAMLSHELRNPLAALSNAAQLLRLQKNEAPLQQEARHVIERQLGQLKHLVDDLLEISRITTGRVRLRQERVSVGGVVERAVETAQPLITQRRHDLTVSLPPEPIFLQADAARLEQVLVNLLTNAAKYTDEGGRIWLSLEQEHAGAMKAHGAVAAPMVVIKVRDSGIGIAPELLPRIFDLFTQADRSIDRSQGGLGIGLCLVRRLVELHGGTVEAHSVLGKGSEFVVRLPLLLTALPASPAPALDTTQPSEKGCRVLVVDDNVDAALSLARLLKLFGHEVEMAYDGPSGLEAALAMRPDVVLLDIGLPGLTGYEVAERIRRQPALKNTVLVAVTGYGRDSDRQRSQEAGFDHHLVKPADFSEVQKILANVAELVA